MKLFSKVMQSEEGEIGYLGMAVIFLVVAVILIGQWIQGPKFNDMNALMIVFIYIPGTLLFAIFFIFMPIKYVIDRAGGNPSASQPKLPWKKVVNAFTSENTVRYMHYRGEHLRIISYFYYLQRKYGKEVFPFGESIISNFSGRVFLGDEGYNYVGYRSLDPQDVHEFFGYEFYRDGYRLMNREDQRELEEVLRRYMVIVFAYKGMIYKPSDGIRTELLVDMLEMAYVHLSEKELNESIKYYKKYFSEERERDRWEREVMAMTVLPPKTIELLQATGEIGEQKGKEVHV